MPSSRHREFTTIRTHFFIPKIENSKMRKRANVIFRLRNTPIRLPIKSFYTKISTTPLHSILSVCWGLFKRPRKPLGSFTLLGQLVHLLHAIETRLKRRDISLGSGKHNSWMSRSSFLSVERICGYFPVQMIYGFNAILAHLCFLYKDYR